jgi:flavin-dependent dehydrogenase
MANETVDVCILGAGMAGLTLARQLQRRNPALSIALLEHRRFPVAEAVHKVGESTVEIAATYLAEDIGLKQHLQQEQLPKFGLRLFVRGEQPITGDIAGYDEIGVSRVLPIPTYQIDRGRLENHLAALVREAGAQLLAGATIRKIELRPGAHQVLARTADSERRLSARYLVDASGRRGWLRNQLHLGKKVRHANHAVWYRTAASFELEQWTDDVAWQGRCHGTPRRLSTNHFTGPGYWLWLIPLASGCTSVGLVFDPAWVDLKEVNSRDKLLVWLQKEHPLVAENLAGHAALDFHVLKDYAVGSEQMFCADGWMLSGDAGVFTDPFYSPGADFIAFANGFISELIAGDGSAERWQKFQQYFLTFYSNTLSLYRGQYGGFGDRKMLLVKTLWDYTYYWGPLAKLFFSGRFTDLEFMDRAQPVLLEAAALNSGMQRKFRTLAKAGKRVGGQGRFFDHHEIPLFHRMKEELLRGDSVCVGTELAASVESLRGLAATLEETMQRVNNGEMMPGLDQLGYSPAFA